VCYQRMLYGADREFGGGWSIWSNGGRSLAPPGKHLLGLHTSDHLTFDEARAQIARLADYVRSYYVDLEDVVEWHEFAWITEPCMMSWQLKPGDRVASRTPIDGLYLEGFTTDVVGVDYDAEAYSALRVADMVLENR
jgi:hypothetical protein